MSRTKYWPVVAALALAPLAQAEVLIDLRFDTDAANIAAVTAQYGLTPAGQLSGALVSGGQLKMFPPTGSLDFGSLRVSS